MTLVDTSVWVDHLRAGNADLRLLLNEGQVICHPFVIGEVACGSLKNRSEVIELMQCLPTAVSAEHDEVLKLLRERQLYSRGLGWVDLHLLAATILSGSTLWTKDRALKEAAEQLSVSQDNTIR